MSMMCLMKPFQGTICIELRASSSSLIASCRSCRPPTTGCCSSARWPRSWPSWRTTSATATSCTFVSMVRRAPQISVVTDFLYTQPRHHIKKPHHIPYQVETFGYGAYSLFHLFPCCSVSSCASPAGHIFCCSTISAFRLLAGLTVEFRGSTSYTIRFLSWERGAHLTVFWLRSIMCPTQLMNCFICSTWDFISQKTSQNRNQYCVLEDLIGIHFRSFPDSSRNNGGKVSIKSAWSHLSTQYSCDSPKLIIEIIDQGSF